jgi:hypothetical protein
MKEYLFHNEKEKNQINLTLEGFYCIIVNAVWYTFYITFIVSCL